MTDPVVEIIDQDYYPRERGVIESATVKAGGVRYRVDLFRDDIDPSFYGEPGTDDYCYSDDDYEAWRRDEWTFAVVAVTELDRSTPISDALGGLEYGSYVWNRGTDYESRSDMEHLATYYPVPAMIGEIQQQRTEADVELSKMAGMPLPASALR